MSQVVKSGDQDEELKIGLDFDGADNFFEGNIDNVMIFDRALSGQEIASLADAAGENVLSVAATVYDKAGNLTVDYRGYKYSYDHQNRLILLDTCSFSIFPYLA